MIKNMENLYEEELHALQNSLEIARKNAIKWQEKAVEYEQLLIEKLGEKPQ